MGAWARPRRHLPMASRYVSYRSDATSSKSPAGSRLPKPVPGCRHAGCDPTGCATRSTKPSPERPAQSASRPPLPPPVALPARPTPLKPACSDLHPTSITTPGGRLDVHHGRRDPRHTTGPGPVPCLRVTKIRLGDSMPGKRAALRPETRFERQRDGIPAVGDPELREQIGDVVADGFVAQDQTPRDVGVRPSICHEGQNFFLACG